MSAPRSANPGTALTLAMLIVLAWVGLALAVNTAQFGDHFEQYTWAHSLEWGYHKHPPLPTLILGAVQRVLGPSPWWAMLLAGLATAGTGLFTFLIARRVLGAQTAALAVLLWGLPQGFTTRAQLWNHNTLMMLCIAAAAWLALQAVERRRIGWWAAAGVLAGLAMLSKYQAILGLLGIVVALAAGGSLREASARRGLTLTIAVALAVSAPHWIWLVQHDFITLNYMSAGDKTGLGVTARLRSLLSFAVIQLRMHLTLLVCLGIGLALSRQPAVAAHEITSPDDRQRRAWLLGLAWTPLVLVLAASLLGGMELQDHWGYQALQFLALPLAWALRGRLARAGLKPWLIGVGCAQLLSMLVYALPAIHPEGTGPSNRPDQFYPARAIAAAALLDWQQETACPLRYVVGPTFEAGIISVYNGGRAVIFDSGNPKWAPWVDAADLAAAGSIVVQMDRPAGATREGRMTLQLPSNKGLRTAEVRWFIVPPADCHAAPTPVQ